MYWLQISTLHVNSLLLMVILIWTQVGLLDGAALLRHQGRARGHPRGGRIDGAGERRIFFRIVVPQIWPTVITVFITVLIGVMKVFDIVYVTTNGAYNTDVIGRRLLRRAVHQGNNGYASAIVVILHDHDHPDPDLPGPSLPGRGGQPMSARRPSPPTSVRSRGERPASERPQRRRRGRARRQRDLCRSASSWR